MTISNEALNEHELVLQLSNLINAAGVPKYIQYDNNELTSLIS
jgi:hypothetical protein